MEENLTVDRTELLEQRTKEIEDGEHYIQIKITHDTIPTEVMDKIGDSVSKGNAINFGDFMEKITNFADENVEHKPIFNIKGKNVSPMDRMVILAFAKDMIENELMRTYFEIMSNEMGDSDEENN